MQLSDFEKKRFIKKFIATLIIIILTRLFITVIYNILIHQAADDHITKLKYKISPRTVIDVVITTTIASTLSSFIITYLDMYFLNGTFIQSK